MASLLRRGLQEDGYAVDVASTGPDAVWQATEFAYDAVLLDLMLPGMSGVEVCRQLRGAGRWVPVLMLTARDAVEDRVRGLDAGADDYLTKPFSVMELTARVKALFRRVEMLGKKDEGAQAKVIQVQDLTIDIERHVVVVRGSAVELTAREFELLVHFARHPGRVYSRDQLLDQVWGYQHSGYDHTVNSHINRLRSKIERDPQNPEYIHTVWGVGYKFADAR